MSEQQSTCRHFARYNREQVQHIRSCIDENKWYLSEKAGHDVGPAAAECDFVKHHAIRVAADFRRGFCKDRCSDRHQCSLAKGVDGMNGHWAGHQPPGDPPAPPKGPTGQS